MPDVAAILAEADWLTRLARSLTGDAAEADDVVQETYAAALRSPPDPDRPVRPWLRRVVMNIVRMRHRGRVRRDAREAEQASEAMPSPDQLLERARMEKALTDLVLALEEPYRATVLLRYREGLTAEAIAKQQGLPAGTVRRRLKTALDQLRAELDEREPTKHWRAAFAPFLVMRGKRTPWWRIAMANVATKTGAAVIAVVVLLLAGGGYWWWRGRATPVAQKASTVAAGNGTAVKAARGDDAHGIALFAQPGVGARELSGRVTAHDKPFAGASVRVVHALTRTMVAELVTDADGRFVVPKLAADKYVVAASAAELSAMPRDVDLRGPTTTIELALVGCTHLRGVVSDGSGTPIAHAQVARESTMWPVAETDALGHYDLCIHFGEAQISYTASGYHGISTHLTVSHGSQRDVVLLPEATLAGTVVRGDGKPVADAWITIDPRGKAGTHDAAVKGRSGDDGAFRIAGVAPGRNEVWAVAPGLASRRIGIVVGAGETQEGLVVRVDPAGQLTGRVVAGGAPVVGASVGLRIGSVPDTERAVTQADGTFAIDRVPRGELGLIVDGHTVIAPRTVSVADRPASVEIEVAQNATIRGTVTLHGAPVADAVVGCPGAQIVTDRSGAFECTTYEGPFGVMATAADGRWGTAEGTLSRGGVATVAIELAQEGRICGTVSDESGKRVAGVRVYASAPGGDDTGDATTASDGSFCVPYLGNTGSFVLALFLDGQQVEPVTPIPAITLVGHRADIAIVIAAPHARIAGTVVDTHGAPVADARLRIRSAKIKSNVFRYDDSGPQQQQFAIADEHGRFHFDHLVPGDYRVLATARDGSEQSVEPIAAGSEDVSITLAAAGRIEGTLVGFTTTPVITGILTSGGHEAIDLEIDGAHFSALGLSPGDYALTADTGGHDGDAKRVTVRAGAATAVTLTSRGTATVTGTVRDWKTRAPVGDALCSAPVARDGAELGTVYNSPDALTGVDALGRFRIDGATAGEVILQCRGGGANAVAMATLVRDKVTNVDVWIVGRTHQSGTIDANLGIATREIIELVQGGAADRAGLAVGDRIVAVDGRPVGELDGRSVMTLIVQRDVGAAVAIAFVRGAETRTVSVTVRAQDF